MIRCCLIILITIFSCGCARVSFPVYDAEKTECIYIREGDDINWECDIKGTGERVNIFD